MEMSTLILAALAKILFIIAIVVGVFAPLLVWAERRQSAMIQDRVGPVRAHIPVPKSVVDFANSTLGLLRLGVVGCFGLAGITLLYFGIRAGGSAIGLWEFSTDYAEALILMFIGLGVLGFFSSLGYKAHSALVDSARHTKDGSGKITVLGLLHPVADALKMIFKEDFVPPKGDKLLHGLAPIVTVIPAIVAFAVIPFGDIMHLDHLGAVTLAGHAFDWETFELARTMSGSEFAAFADANIASAATLGAEAIPLQIASLDVGVLFLFAVASTGVIGAAIGGYASDNKYSLMGGIRAASQMVSYEVALGLTIVPCFMLYDSLRLEEMVAWQMEHVWGLFVPMLTFGSILYSFAAIAETKRVPFDLPEGESELVGGYLTEYSGLKFGMFFTGEFVEVAALAMIFVALFLGGWDAPFLYSYGLNLPFDWTLTIPMTSWEIGDTILLSHWVVVLLQVGIFLVKTVLLIWAQLMIRWSLPRFRYDQIMALCWKGLLPLALVNILITGVILLIMG